METVFRLHHSKLNWAYYSPEKYQNKNQEGLKSVFPGTSFCLPFATQTTYLSTQDHFPGFEYITKRTIISKYYLDKHKLLIPSTPNHRLQNTFMCELQSLYHVWLFATPWTIARQAPPSMGFSRQEYCSRLPFPSPGDLPNPGIETTFPAQQVDSLPLSHRTTKQ